MLKALTITFIALLAALVLAEGDAPYSTKVKQGSEAGEYSVKIVYPHFAGDAALLKFANEQIEQQAESALEQFVETVNDVIKSEKKKPKKAYTRDWTPVISIANGDLVSMYFKTFEGQGDDAPPHGAFTPLTYSVVAGEPQQVHYADLFQKSHTVLAKLSAIVLPKLKEAGAASVVDGSIKELNEEQADLFVITPSTITFLFPQGYMGPVGAGPYIVKVPLAEFKDMVDPKGPLKSVWKTL